MTQQLPPERSSQPNIEDFSRDCYRNRQVLLNKVRNYWLKGVLKKSLSGKGRIELGLEERWDTIQCPWGVAWETTDAPRQILPPHTKVIDKFDELGTGRSLLILGEPGSGKTTTLLQLVHELCDRAEQNTNQPLPVVFNLSSWIGEAQTINEWLVTELYTQYQIPRVTAQLWLKKQQLLLMLDGLDEVKEQQRALCVQALNEFAQERGQTEMVVCSRLKDYEILPERLRLQSAIYLQPLTSEQVHRYLTAGGEEMAALSALLQQDTTLQELVTTPLMLNILTLAYKGMSVADLPSLNSTEEHRKHLFNAYIERMLTRRENRQGYSKAQSVRWLSELAFRMTQQSQTVLLIERIQPSWLQLNLKDGFTLPFFRNGKRKTPAYQQYATGVRLTSGVLWGLIIGLFCSVGGDLNFGLKWGIVSGIIVGLGTKVEQIKPVESLKWSWSKAQKLLPYGLLCAVGVGLNGWLFWGVVTGLVVVMIGGLVGSDLETTTVPNQGIWQSTRNASVFAFIGGILCLMGGAEVADSLGQPLDILVLVGGMVGLILALTQGGTASLRHFILRLVLYRQGYAPWNYAGFLNYAAEQTFLQKVGGGYIFIHRLLQEHFMALGIENSSQTVEINPDDAEAYIKRGNVRASLGNYQEALADYTQAIQINPDLAEAYVGRSLACFQLGDYPHVMEDYQQVFQLNPTLAKSVAYQSNDSEATELKSVEEADQAYEVIVLNDSFNSFNHVAECLMRYIPGLTSDRSMQLTKQIDQEGQAVVWSGCQELAELYRLQLSNAGLSMDLCWPKVN
jgi:ATP-dependent Clp protease adapter protein ClpS